MDFQVVPLFSTPVTCCKAPFDVKPLFGELKNESLFPRCGTTASVLKGAKEASAGSNDMLVLDKFPKQKMLLTGVMNTLMRDVFKHTSNELIMTTSWLTRAEQGSCGHWHAHFNSMFSGVLYEKGGDGFAPIEFEKGTPNEASLQLEDPGEWNILNASSWSMDPEEGSLIFFPSYLRHRVGLHCASEPRYSVAFNFFPSGCLGVGDSQVGLKVL